jgi:tetratricopeptide (TPR) repeat protein
LLQQQEVEKSLPELEAAVRLDPKLLPARASLGLAYARSGKAAEAIPHLEAALDIDEDGSLHYQLARAYQASGKAELAKQTMQKYTAMQRQSDEQKRSLEEQAKITPP